MDSQQGSGDDKWEVVDVDGGSDNSWDDLAEFDDGIGDGGNSSEDVDEYSNGNSDGDDTLLDVAENTDGDEEEEVEKKHYTILKEETMKHLQRYDSKEVFEEWFADDERSRAAVGIPADEKPGTPEGSYCVICTKTVGFSGALSGSCGSGCRMPRYPEQQCATTVAGLDTVEEAAAEDHKCRFDESLRRSYVESSRNRKWCPRPRSEFAVEIEGGGDGDEETYETTYDCGYKFCWRCAEEQHHRAGCDEVVKWTKKNSSEAADQIDTWILTLICTKSCPKCDKKIEKTQGCNRVKCGACNHQFCWFCLHN
ncbi:probable E3 ubiquitin-protein ligase ARI11 [Salvia miltiorrhiza]|uniref:probable E3 ubiquitin-protein ligase ARI11 n=1 Tax=Salvia miltiorrhiza TaxID=226208 RepID=UPI0025AD68DE|nr:probable E3 ubiquitin-protein ligase ARI11 [Salvia miltiorrhiza]